MHPRGMCAALCCLLALSLFLVSAKSRDLTPILALASHCKLRARVTRSEALLEEKMISAQRLEGFRSPTQYHRNIKDPARRGHGVLLLRPVWAHLRANVTFLLLLVEHTATCMHAYTHTVEHTLS